MAGADFAVVAGDTRMSTGYSILSRNMSKLCKLYAATCPQPSPRAAAAARLPAPQPRPRSPAMPPITPSAQLVHSAPRRTDTVVLATAGFRGDISTLQKLLRAKLTEYEQKHGEAIKVHAVAQMLANTLYGRRFFPYYTWNVLAGIDEDGVGCVYSYDPVGNYERVRVNVTGSGGRSRDAVVRSAPGKRALCRLAQPRD